MQEIQNEKDFMKIYQDYYGLLLNKAYEKTGNSHDAEDICQILFISFYEKHETIRNPKSWLFGALRLLVFNYYKKVKFDDKVIFVDNNFKGFDMISKKEDSDIRIIIEELLNHDSILTDQSERDILDMIAIEGLSFMKTGEKLGIKHWKVRYRYYELIKKIQYFLRSKGVSEIGDLI